MKSTYEFLLRFELPDAEEDSSRHLDALFEAGCDDATIGVGKKGFLSLDFSREGASAEETVRSALADVQEAIPGSKLVEIQPDLVNLADLADLLGCSRQNVRKYAAGEIRRVSSTFPAPVHSGSTDLWRLYEVAAWLVRNTDLKPSRELVETACTAAAINIELQQRRHLEVITVAS